MKAKNPFFNFFDSNETLIFMSKFSIEACQQMKYELFVPRKEGHIFSYHVQKEQKFTQKLTCGASFCMIPGQFALALAHWFLLAPHLYNNKKTQQQLNHRFFATFIVL